MGTKVFAADALMTMNRSFNVSLRFTVQWKLVWQKNPWHRQIKVKALPFMYIYICNIHVLIMKTFIKEFDGERIILDERNQILQSNSVSIKCKAALNLSFSFLAWNISLKNKIWKQTKNQNYVKRFWSCYRLSDAISKERKQQTSKKCQCQLFTWRCRHNV